MMKFCFALCLKRYVKGTDAEDWPKDPICLQYVNLQSMQVFQILDSKSAKNTNKSYYLSMCTMISLKIFEA